MAKSGFSKFFYPHGEFRAEVLLAMARSRRFIRIRWIIVITILGLLLLEHWLRPEHPRPLALVWSAAALAAINVVWTIVSRWLLGETPNQDSALQGFMLRIVWFVNAQMTVDLLFLTVVLRYSGGIENPMVIFYLLHMLIAALLLRPLNALLQGCWGVLLFAGLVFGEYAGLIAPHYPFLPIPPSGSLHQEWTHAVTATGVLAASVLATLYFTLQISAHLDEQESKLRGALNALRRSQNAIKDLQARRSRFMQTAAHQLKSPLAGVQTLAGLVHDGVVPADSVRATCARIIQRCREGISQVGELLTLARIQQADPEHRGAETCNVRQVVLKLCQRYKPLAEQKQITLGWSVPEGRNLLARVNANNLTDCVGNLLDNAIKYTNGPGRVNVNVTLGRPADIATDASLQTCSPDENVANQISITVSDTGMGIEPNSLLAIEDAAEKRSIFDAFLRGNNALAAGIPGTGLGLAIVREVVEQADGQILVHSEPGHGSSFTVVFPTAETGPGSASIQHSGSRIVVSDPKAAATRKKDSTAGPRQADAHVEPPPLSR